MTRTRPKVSFEIIDDSFVLPVESLLFGATKPIIACWAPDLHSIATPEELQIGYMTETSQSNWFARVRLLSEHASGVSTANSNYSSIVMQGVTGDGVTTGGAIGLLNGAYGTTYTIPMLSGASGSTYTAGLSNEFRPNWWAVQNALQYGTTCRIGVAGIGFTSGGYNTSGTLSPLSTATDFAIPGLYDIIFQSFHNQSKVQVAGDLTGWTGTTWNATASQTNVLNIVNALDDSERPVMGVLSVGLTGSVSSSANVGAASTTPNEFIVQVAGDKYHLNSIANSSSSSLLRTHLAPDVAGCIANTPYVWSSPAGTSRGRILNVVSLANKFTTTAQDVLYEENVNPVITIPGSGTVLYGDITNAEDTSSLVSINVIRTIIFIKTSLLPIANEVMFELNDTSSRSAFTVRAEFILRKILNAGGLSEFTVVCDESNNPQEIIDAKAFVADIKVKIPGSINYINISLTNQ